MDLNAPQCVIQHHSLQNSGHCFTTLPVCMPPKDRHELKPAFGRKKHSSTHPFLGFWKPVVWRRVPRFPFPKTPKDSGTVHGRVCSSCLTHGACGLGVSGRSKVGGTTWWDLRVVWLLPWLVALSVCRGSENSEDHTNEQNRPTTND